MEKVLWNRCFICSIELEANEDVDNQASPSQPVLESDIFHVPLVDENILELDTGAPFPDSLSAETESNNVDEPLIPTDDSQSLLPTANRSHESHEAKTHNEDILLQYLLTHCQRNGIIGKLLFEDIKKLKSSSVDTNDETDPQTKCAAVKFCGMCDGFAEDIKDLHLELEALQIKICDKVKLVKQTVVSNSMLYGCNNEGARSHFDKFETWLQQQEKTGEDYETGRKFLQVLRQFHTIVFESSTRVRDMPLEQLQRFMGTTTTTVPPPTRPAATNAQEFPDFDYDSSDDEEVSFMPHQFLQTDFSVSEDPLYLKSPLIKSKKPKRKRRCRGISRRNKAKKITRRGLAEQIKKLKMMLQKRTFTKVVVQQAGQYRITINQNSPPPSPLSPNSDNEIVEFKDYKPGYKLQVVKSAEPQPPSIFKKTVVVTKTEAQKLAPKLRREWLILRKEKNLKKKGSVMCDLCSRVTIGTSRTEQHLREHETCEKYWKCPDCEKAFTTKQYYELHVMHYCGVEMWRCDSCELPVPRNEISDHLQDSHNGCKTYSCGQCDLFFVTFPNLIVHSLCHTGEQKLRCEMCPQNPDSEPFTSKRRLLRHLADEHNQTQLLIKCDVENCSATYFTSGDLWGHKKTHCLPSFGCVTCGQTFLTNYKLQMHVISRHSSEPMFQCFQCSKKFQTKGQRERHLIDEHGIRKYKCELCPTENFSSTFWLRYHKKIKHNLGDMTQYQCSICDKVFYHKGKFKDHEKTHSAIKNMRCHICPFATKTANLLKSHLTTHEGIKKYSCLYCGKKFVHKKYLRDHHRIHTLERPWQCDLCGSTFNQQSALKVHKNKHAADALFVPRPTRASTRKQKALELEEAGRLGHVDLDQNDPNVIKAAEEAFIMSTMSTETIEVQQVDSCIGTTSAMSTTFHNMDQQQLQLPIATITIPGIPSTSTSFLFDGTIGTATVQFLPTQFYN